MGAFLEERLPVNIRLGASFVDGYAVEITTTASGVEYRKLTHPHPIRTGTISFTMLRNDLAGQVLDLYHRAYGTYAGFRVKCVDDYSTNNYTGIPTAFDFTAVKLTDTTYQIARAYGSAGTPLSIGFPYRKIYKPIAGSILVGVNSVAMNYAWTASTTTGIITFGLNKTSTITGITKASQAVISTTGGPYFVTESAHISGVVGMTEINGKRGVITSVNPGVSITVNIDTSSGYSTYVSGGTLNLNPQTGESVTAGCYFDLPFRFNSKIEVGSLSSDVRDCNLEIIELIAP